MKAPVPLARAARRAAAGGGGAWLALAALLLVCAASDSAFRNPRNLLNVARQVSYGGIVAMGMTWVIAAGGIDLSVGSLFAFSGVVALLAERALPP
ncbi:MAG: ABC transporter permease, partial [Kiritimatiellae bacterium]|nr:ABC transporter permease [Kiritimatiellia bacterium]